VEVADKEAVEVEDKDGTAVGVVEELEEGEEESEGITGILVMETVEELDKEVVEEPEALDV